MMFTYPWMLLGLLGLPTLAAIYWLRSRSRMRVVSSLILWNDQRTPKQGGRIFQRLQTPLTLLLELLAIAAIVLAAAGPAWTRSQFARPIIVVLDDSYSMLAGGTDSARSRAADALAAELRGTEYLARFVLAGARPRLLGEPVRAGESLAKVLGTWTCKAPTAALEQAIALASEVGGAEARILVLSDHSPDAELPPGKVQWRSFGRPLPNVALTAAARSISTSGGKGPEDRVLYEVTNFSAQPVKTELNVEGADLTAPRRNPVDLAPGAASRFFLNIPSGTPALRAKLGDDNLTIDNNSVLVSPHHRLLRVQLAIGNAQLRAPFTRALEASGQATLVDSRPELLITDGPAAQTDAWQLQILPGPDPVSFEGPFVLDRNHPLTEGLSLEAVIWTAGAKVVPAGAPVITAGNTVLFADKEDASGRHVLQMALQPELSNLTDNPDWPILIANLVRWRLAALPGSIVANVRLLQPVKITLSDEAAAAKEAVLVLPGGVEQKLPIRSKTLELQPEQTGLYTLKAGPMKVEFACNALHPDESNLTACATGTWGDWNQSQVFEDQRVSLAWIFALTAIGCLAVHMDLVHRTKGAAT